MLMIIIYFLSGAIVVLSVAVCILLKTVANHEKRIKELERR